MQDTCGRLPSYSISDFIYLVTSNLFTITHVRPIQEKRHGPFICTLNYFPAGKASLRGPITPSLNVSALSVKGEGSTCPVLNTLAPVFQPPHPACFSVPPSCLAFLHFGNTVIGHWLGHLGSTSDSQAPINTDYQVSWFYHSQRTCECVPHLQEVWSPARSGHICCSLFFVPG